MAFASICPVNEAQLCFWSSHLKLLQQLSLWLHRESCLPVSCLNVPQTLMLMFPTLTLTHSECFYTLWMCLSAYTCRHVDTVCKGVCVCVWADGCSAGCRRAIVCLLEADHMNRRLRCWAGRQRCPFIIKPPPQVQGKPTLFVTLCACVSVGDTGDCWCSLLIHKRAQHNAKLFSM